MFSFDVISSEHFRCSFQFNIISRVDGKKGAASQCWPKSNQLAMGDDTKHYNIINFKFQPNQQKRNYNRKAENIQNH